MRACGSARCACAGVTQPPRRGSGAAGLSRDSRQSLSRRGAARALLHAAPTRQSRRCLLALRAGTRANVAQSPRARAPRTGPESRERAPAEPRAASPSLASRRDPRVERRGVNKPRRPDRIPLRAGYFRPGERGSIFVGPPRRKTARKTARKSSRKNAQSSQVSSERLPPVTVRGWTCLRRASFIEIEDWESARSEKTILGKSLRLEQLNEQESRRARRD